MIDLSGRVVIVTGGNSGIGLGIARGVARAGASVAVWSRRHERNTEAVAELERLGATAIGAQCDVSDEDNVAGVMRETLDRFGRLDCLAWMTTLSLTGHSLGRLRASSLDAVAVPTPGICNSASQSGSTDARSSSGASPRSISLGMADSSPDTIAALVSNSCRTASGRQAISSNETASRSLGVTASRGLLPRQVNDSPAKSSHGLK